MYGSYEKVEEQLVCSSSICGSLCRIEGYKIREPEQQDLRLQQII